jgi:hypothetical protein
MARGHGRILTSVWEDADFLALDEREQRLYLFLISQPNLNHAGLLDLTLRRWARKARGLTVAELDRRIATLEEARFVVVDDDTEELLIRTFVRNDGVWRMPKVMGAMVSGAAEISSVKLRLALLDEMNRLPLDELSNEPGARGMSVRQQVDEHLDNLRRTLRVPDPTPPKTPCRRVADTPPEGLPKGSETPSDTHGEGDAEASTRGRAPTSHAHSPAPAPAPAPATNPIKEGGGSEGDHSRGGSVAEAERPDGLAPIDVDGFTLSDGMRRWAVRDGYAPLIDVDYETAQFVSHHRAQQSRRKSWPDEWQKWIRRAHKWATESPQRRATGSNVIQLPSGQTLTGTDAKVAAHSALTEQLRALERETS